MPGVGGCASNVRLEGNEMQPAIFFAVTECEELATNPLYINVVEKESPSRLYVSPITPEIMMPPVADEQVGCVGVSVGADGVDG
jgi:hypothetical protein